MLNSQKFWKIRTPDPRMQVAFSNELRVHPIISQLLVNRGITVLSEAEQFLSARTDQLHDPFQLTDMARTVERIRQARDKRETVMVYGDYDVDGVTSSALLTRTLMRMGLEVINHIPHRMKDGYGLNARIAAQAKDKGVGLLITVDCGITSIREVAKLNQAGVDVIIIDHHEAAEDGLPEAVAIVNPKRPDCPYPFKSMATVGLVAKLVQALTGKIPMEDLDLVALGTIADVVPLRGENRIYVKNGLPLIGRTRNVGLSALMDVAKINRKKIRPYYVGFILGPRINATGRMDSAQKSLELLMTDCPVKARELAELLEETNARRQKMQRDVVQQALQQIEQDERFKDQQVIVIGQEGWHKGVLGIVASKVTDTFYRPSIVISWKDGIGTASARSIEGFHLHDALTDCADVLDTYGGHQLAAGLTIRQENMDRFRLAINAFANKVLQSRNLIPSLEVDCEIPLSALSLDLVNIIDQLEPYGEGNPEPVFCSRQLIVKSPPRVLSRETLKFWVTDGQAVISAVGFGMGKYSKYLYPGKKIDLAYQIAIDDWNKAPTVQIKIKDIKDSSSA